MKVLIISHNPISTYNNMGKTLQSLFSEFKKEELCQLYIYPSIPDVKSCSSYYRITDIDVVRGIFRFHVKGRKISDSDIISGHFKMLENANYDVVYGKQSNHSSFKRIARDILWKISNWYTKELEEWIELENPDCIFVATGYSKFLYDIALKISNKKNLPIFSYICDDYYFVNTPTDVSGRLYLVLLQKKIESLINRTRKLFVISEELKEIYEKEFHVSTKVVMTGSNYSVAKTPRIVKEPQSISYFGNIGCGRYVSLADIGKCLDMINAKNHTEYKLKIYTNAKSENILKKLKSFNAIEICGYLQGEKFKEALLSSELLLHVEDFSKESIDLVKHSVSTKIADSLASGIPLIAYGPNSIASMKHLIRNNCAIIAEKSNLSEVLSKTFAEAVYRENIVKNAICTAQKYHDSKNVSSCMKDIMEKVIND